MTLEPPLLFDFLAGAVFRLVPWQPFVKLKDRGALIEGGLPIVTFPKGAKIGGRQREATLKTLTTLVTVVLMVSRVHVRPTLVFFIAVPKRGKPTSHRANLRS
jgi:hypothetical protein